MDYWFVFLLAGAVFIALDFILGLALVFVGLGLLLIAIGLAGVSGINLTEYDAVIEWLVVLIFTPIFVRLYFVLQRQRSSTTVGGSGAGGIGGPQDRNASKVYKGIVVAGKVVPLFTFHFITGGLAIVAGAVLAGWINPEPQIGALALVGFPYIANFLADTREVTTFKRVLYVAGGILLVPIYTLAVILAGLALHPQQTPPV